MDIGIHDGGHLCFLDGTDFAVGVHDEDGDILLSSQSVDGSRASVSAGCADDRQVFPIPPALAFIPADEEVFEEVAQEL